MTTASIPTASAGHRYGGRAVVIVDDEEDNRELLRELLQLRGFAVTTAANGAEALDILRGDAQPCFVLLDLAMPVLDGHAVLAAVRTDPALQRAPICVATATPQLVPHDVPCLPKPIDVKKLIALIGELAGPDQA